MRNNNVQQLIDHYRQLVEAMPEIRNCISYSEENNLKCLLHLSAKHSSIELEDVLVFSCMRMLRGQENPTTVLDIVRKWKQAHNESTS